MRQPLSRMAFLWAALTRAAVTLPPPPASVEADLSVPPVCRSCADVSPTDRAALSYHAADLNETAALGFGKFRLRFFGAFGV